MRMRQAKKQYGKRTKKDVEQMIEGIYERKRASDEVILEVLCEHEKLERKWALIVSVIGFLAAIPMVLIAAIVAS